jgi:hypothetical protein
MKHAPLHAMFTGAVVGLPAEDKAVELPVLYIRAALAAIVGRVGIVFATGYVLMFDSLCQGLPDVLSNTCVYDASITPAQQKGFRVLAPTRAPDNRTEPFARGRLPLIRKTGIPRSGWGA